LLSHKADIDAVDSSKNTPLHYAIKTENLKIVKVILTKYPRIDLQNIENKNSL